MSAVKGRRRREPRGVPRVLLQAWLEPELRDKVRLAADSAGISMARYLTALIERDEVHEDGRPVWLPPAPDTGQQELDLKSA